MPGSWKCLRLSEHREGHPPFTWGARVFLLQPPQSWPPQPYSCTPMLCDCGVWDLRGPSSSATIHQSSVVLLLNLVSTWIAFSSVIENRGFQKEQEKTTDIPKPGGYTEIRNWHILSAFQAREQADEMSPWHHVHGASQCHSKTLYGKISAQSRAARERTQNSELGKTRACSDLALQNMGDVLLVLRRRVVTVFSHIIRQCNLLGGGCFVFPCVISILHKTELTDRSPFSECWIL